jgi:hypothetical protein
MTGRESDQGWAADSQVASWLGDTTDTADRDAPSTEPQRAEPDSEQPAWLGDTTMWAQNSTVSGWLATTGHPADANELEDQTGYVSEESPLDSSGYHAQVTAPMAPIAAAVTDPGEASPPTRRGTVEPAPAPTPAGPKRPRTRRRPNRRTATMAAAVLAAAVVVLGLIITAASFMGDAGDDGGEPIAQPPAPSASIAPTPPAEDAGCPNSTADGVITGRDPGGTTSGPAVIKAFEHAYYVQRNGAKARSYGTELARMGTAASMQSFIDTQLAPGTTYCTRITDRGSGLFSLELNEIPPGGGEPVLIRQLVQTAQVDGRTLITAITKDTNQ